MKSCVDPTPKTGKQFYQQFHGKDKVVMLNMLKFKERADYEGLEDIRPDRELSGEEAYALYLEKINPVIQSVGSKALFYGKSHEFLIGPEHETWDTVLLVEHPSAEKFIAFSQYPDYLQHAGHRKAALADSRLLPITQL